LCWGQQDVVEQKLPVSERQFQSAMALRQDNAASKMMHTTQNTYNSKQHY